MRTIAIIEDNDDNRLLLNAMLSDQFELTEYETGREAIGKIGLDIPDLILLDISLPEMDGVEVLAWLRRQPALTSIPVIALTAHAMAGDREKFLARGFNGYLAKPIVDPDALVDEINRLLA